MPRSLEQDVRGHIEIHDPARAAQYGSIRRIQHCAPPRREDNACGLRAQLRNGLRLTPPESRFAFQLKDQRNPNTGSMLDFVVRVKKNTPHAPGKNATNRRLARAHEADEINVSGIRGHAAFYISAAKRQN